MNIIVVIDVPIEVVNQNVTNRFIFLYGDHWGDAFCSVEGHPRGGKRPFISNC